LISFSVDQVFSRQFGSEQLISFSVDQVFSRQSVSEQLISRFDQFFSRSVLAVSEQVISRSVFQAVFSEQQ
jgi:hypothetical protein